MRLYLLYILLGGGLLAIQAHPLLPFAQQGIRPDLLLVLVIYLGTRPEIERWAGALLVSLLGYLTAAFSGSPVGLYAFIYLFFFVSISLLQNILDLYSVYLQVLLVVICGILEGALFFILCWGFYNNPHILGTVKGTLPKQLAFTVAVAPVLLVVLNYVTARVSENKALNLFAVFSKSSSVKPAS
jgi:cell shape-determining protein MreD